jgi:hypothetical protein
MDPWWQFSVFMHGIGDLFCSKTQVFLDFSYRYHFDDPTRTRNHSTVELFVLAFDESLEATQCIHCMGSVPGFARKTKFFFIFLIDAISTIRHQRGTLRMS